MNYLDLFSGIGGFRLGAGMAGIKFENEFHSDIDVYANKVYKKHYTESIQLGDITKIKCEDLLKYGSEWIITGGFPCQDISIAGKGAGLEGSRSGLWFEMWRIISGIQPRFAIMENVAALTFRGLDRVLGSLAEIGYNAEWQDIRAEDMGAPHRRERLWIVAYPEQKRWRKRPNVERVSSSVQEGRKTSNITCDSDQTQGIMADTEKQRLEGLRQNRKLSSGIITGCGGAIGKKWPVEPTICRVVNGLPNRSHRLRCLGNSIVPQIAELLFNQIKEYL